MVMLSFWYQLQSMSVIVIHHHLQTTSSIGKILMVVKEMLLVPRIALHGFVVLQIFEHDLTEAIIVGDVSHLTVV